MLNIYNFTLTKPMHVLKFDAIKGNYSFSCFSKFIDIIFFAAEDCFTFMRTVDLSCVLYHIYVPWEENFI